MYRKKYAVYTGEQVPSSFDIHHIDFDEENNEIKNLVALPRQLHQKFHELLNKVPDDFQFDWSVGPTFLDQSSPSNLYFANHILLLSKCHYECEQWLLFRDYLLGVSPHVNREFTYQVGGVFA